uniref:Uncharacterized protein n=1 Tax=Physcomitrium patens TaxID=3218 RepID=A0A2K1JIR1_PHYPA|nr:hypothetical protein PHYPA_018841 [Physcomitrium patens]
MVEIGSNCSNLVLLVVVFRRHFRRAGDGQKHTEAGEPNNSRPMTNGWCVHSKSDAGRWWGLSLAKTSSWFSLQVSFRCMVSF